MQISMTVSPRTSLSSPSRSFSGSDLRIDPVLSSLSFKKVLRCVHNPPSPALNTLTLKNLSRPPSPPLMNRPNGDGDLIRVAYEGAPGSHFELAALQTFPNCLPIPYQHLGDVLQAVEIGHAAFAMLLREPRLFLTFRRNTCYFGTQNLMVVEEVAVPVHHCLLALPGVQKEDLKVVISDDLALYDCQKTLDLIFPPEQVKPPKRQLFYDGAGAAKFLALNQLRDKAAIASSRAADLYGLEILKEDMAVKHTKYSVVAGR